MTNTRSNVQSFALNEGYEPIQIDGIPEGFSFKMPDIQIGDSYHIGECIAFIPNSDVSINSYSIELLQEIYKTHVK